MKYATGLSGFIGRNLKNKIKDLVAVSHQDIYTTDWSKATEVYFLSSYGNMAFHEDTNEIVKANISDLVHVLTNVDWKKIKTFVFVSTSSVKLRTQTTYSRTKRAAEEICLAFIEKLDAPITVIRPMSVTGRNEQKEHLIPKLIDSCLNDTHMNFVSSPTHDYIDVDDLTDGIINLSKNRARGIFELGHGVAISNLQVLELVKKITGKTANITLVDSMRDYDNDKWVSENFKARSWGWIPLKSLELSITEMVNDTRNNKTN